MRNKELKSKRGITLIALVVTIVVLLILAGITINLVFADGGILQKASDAADRQKEAEESDKAAIESLGEQANTILNGGSLGGGENPPAGGSTVEELIGKPAVDTNQDVVDRYGNKITIPAGFIVVPDGTSNVEYTYTGDKKPAVQDGIVIQDGDENQFVWVPVGTINNKEGDSRGATSTIDLARYNFDIDLEGQNTELQIVGTGEIQNKTTDGNIALGSGEYKELSFSNYGNSTAKEIEVFFKKSNEKGGYYIARYEASYRDGTKPYSKESVETLESFSAKSKTEGNLWNHINQSDAANAARAMYDENGYFASDLVNSYAWDTAIVFIQMYSGQPTYSMQTSKNTVDTINAGDTVNTGERVETTDKVCNVYDMASNLWEWTTETNENETCSCVFRGSGIVLSNLLCPGMRFEPISNDPGDDYRIFLSFRSILYITK